MKHIHTFLFFGHLVKFSMTLGTYLARLLALLVADRRKHPQSIPEVIFIDFRESDVWQGDIATTLADFHSGKMPTPPFFIVGEQ